MHLGLFLALGMRGTGDLPVWSPLTDTATLAWWTADRADLIGLSGANATSWTDAKNGYVLSQATGTAQPLYSATSFNGAPGITFDGVDDRLDLAPAPFVNEDPIEFWVVMQQDALAADTTQRVVLNQGGVGTTARGIRRVVVSGVNRTRAQVGSVVSTLGTADFSGRHVIRAKFEAAQASIYQDGVGSTPSATTPAADVVRFRVGGYGPSDTLYLQGQIRSIWAAGPTADFAQAASYFAALLP